MHLSDSRKTVNFSDWLDACLAWPLPTQVAALLFNLSRRELNVCVELTGTNEFSRVGRQWTWSECWDPDRPALILPFSGGSKSEAHDRHAAFIRSGLTRYLESGLYRRRFDHLYGVALESAEDEAIELLWQRSDILRARAQGAA